MPQQCSLSEHECVNADKDDDSVHIVAHKSRPQPAGDDVHGDADGDEKVARVRVGAGERIDSWA